MQFPEICTFDAETTMQEIRKKAPFYVPEWNTEDEEDFGIVLSHIFSRMADLISTNLNEAPKKHFLSFLEMINASLIPASPARAPLTFVLSGGTPEDITIEATIEAFTQASAEDSSGKKVIFETEKLITATTSKLMSVYSVINTIKGKDKKENEDKIFSHTVAIDGVESTQLFSGKSLQKHVLYIGDERLFNVQKGQIIIEFEAKEAALLKKLDPNQGLVEWTYSAGFIDKENGKEKIIDWQPLEPGLKDNKLILSTRDKPVCKVKLNEIESRWIKCQLKDSRIEELKELRIRSIKIVTSPSTSDGIIPDCLFNNDIPIDPNSDLFYPFGKTPFLYDTFYIASKDAFSKEGYKITLLISLKFDVTSESSKNEIDKPQLSWEFWDGESWSLLPVKGEEDGEEEWKKNLSEPTISKESSKPIIKDTYTYELTVPMMPEVKLTRVNGKENYWIRVRLVSGNYGKEYKIVSSGENVTAEGNNTLHAEVVPGTFFAPKITRLKIKYDVGTNSDGTNYETGLLTCPEYVFAENNLIFKNCLEKLEKENSEEKFFKPFQSLSDSASAIYFGFDKELKMGSYSLFINIDESIESPESFLPKVKWQYLINVSSEIWEELDVLDETKGFTKRGMVQFSIPGKMQAYRLFDLEDRYWIRAVIAEDSFILPEPSDQANQSLTSLVNSNKSNIPVQLEYSPPKIRGFYLNSVWAIQAKTISDEIVGSGTGEINQRFKLINAPVVDEEVWVNEIDTLSETERKSLLAEQDKVILKKDSKSNIVDFWVKWVRVNDFLDSKSKSRDYVIDRTDGDISFGNGKYGMTPPIGSGNIKVTYKTGGGKSGNFEASQISKLQSSIAFVDKIFNPIRSNGGAENEDVDSLLKRAPAILKTRNHAITLEDYEWLAKEASKEVAKVKVFPTTDTIEYSSASLVTVLIVPESSNPKPFPTSELKRKVASYLEERCPTAVTLRVISPSYVKVDVYTELVSTSIDAIPVIEKEARKKLSEFFHPLTGNGDKKGWNFGCILYISDIYAILKKIKGVDYVNKVNINLYYEPGITGTATKLDDNCAVVKLKECNLPYSGEHEIKIEWKNSQEGV